MAASAWTCFISAFFNSVELGSAAAAGVEEEPKKDMMNCVDVIIVGVELSVESNGNLVKSGRA